MSKSRYLAVRDAHSTDVVDQCLPDRSSRSTHAESEKERNFEFGDDELAQKSAKHFLRCIQYIDLMHAPDEAESIIGDLHEQYLKRLKADPNHATPWIWS